MPSAQHSAAIALRRTAEIQSVSQPQDDVRIRLPGPSKQRLERSLQDRASNPSKFPHTTHSEPSEKEETFLYLAYGSNLFSGTFLGKRGIRPLSAINVVVPDLVMTFDLAGIPYSEPCFANTRYRKPNPPLPWHGLEKSSPSASERPPYHNPTWPRGLVGVVYEVTHADYTHILATEGGGAAYQDILIDCYPLPPGVQTVPEHPTTTPFKAHTLYSPVYPLGKAPPGQQNHFARPDPEYAQPSLRYLTLIRTGADEHDFPADYKAYLHQLKPYTIKSQRQQMGQFIFLQIWRPFLTAFFKISAKYADKDGKSPKWLVTFAAGLFVSMWVCYDQVFYPIFGDGERTQKGEGDKEEA